MINNEKIQLFKGDCLDVMDDLIKNNVKVDAIITDLPYGITNANWDEVIPFDEMWCRIKKMVNKNTPIVLFGNQPFTSKLICSNLKGFKYVWEWNKKKPANVLSCRYQPLRIIEDIIVFTVSGERANYYPILTIDERDRDKEVRRYFNSQLYGATNYNYKTHKKGNQRYPKNLLEYSNASRKEFTLHPTQKPVALLEYLIRTYTKEDELVLDFTMGSGSTGVACANTNRRFIGIELDDNYFEIAKRRIEECGFS